MELSYENADALVITIGGESAEHLAAFVASLIGQQYTVSYVCLLARQALVFARWCKARSIPFSTLTYADITRYQRHRSRLRSRCAETRRRELHALELLLRFLCCEGICPPAPIHATPVDDMAAAFTRHLEHCHGLANSTVETYTRIARQFLVWRFGSEKINLQAVSTTDVIGFVQNESRRMGPPALKCVVNALRAFLRYCQFRGVVSPGLVAAVPAVAGWATTPSIPKAISADHAQRAIDSCDCQTAVGLRDRAVLLLLARLGLRAVEIVRLMLEDIDWEYGRLRIHGKGGKEGVLPLTADVGEAIAIYLKHGRPKSQDRRLFLRSVAPIRGMMEGSDGIGTIVRTALRRAKVNAPHRGSHQFRHALAVQMLQAGASLPEIGQVLRHSSPQSTSIYAKVDLDALRGLAMEWPGGAL